MSSHCGGEPILTRELDYFIFSDEFSGPQQEAAEMIPNANGHFLLRNHQKSRQTNGFCEWKHGKKALLWDHCMQIANPSNIVQSSWRLGQHTIDCISNSTVHVHVTIYSGLFASASAIAGRLVESMKREKIVKHLNIAAEKKGNWKFTMLSATGYRHLLLYNDSVFCASPPPPPSSSFIVCQCFLVNFAKRRDIERDLCLPLMNKHWCFAVRWSGIVLLCVGRCRWMGSQAIYVHEIRFVCLLLKLAQQQRRKLHQRIGKEILLRSRLTLLTIYFRFGQIHLNVE